VIHHHTTPPEVVAGIAVGAFGGGGLIGVLARVLGMKVK
jgi:S-adenosylmethionine synthetase